MADPQQRGARPDGPTASGPVSSDTTRDDPLTDPDLPETWIGVYRVLRLLGTGGMGDVFLAFDARLQRRVAIKRIRSDGPASPRARERFRREAAAAAGLSHPAIVHVYDILAEESGEAIVMEYVEGQTLAQARARAPLTVRQTVGIGRQVAEGLAAAHAVGLIHRDLKTQNVMLTPSGQAKILDFGVAKRLRRPPDDNSLTAEGAVPGTLRSMSPEQAQGSTLDERSDLFSLGVLLYEVCTGRPPFQGDSPTETLLKVTAEPPTPVADLRPELPAPFAALIGQLLEKDPERRPASAEEVVARLQEIETLWAPELEHPRSASGERACPRARPLEASDRRRPGPGLDRRPRHRSLPTDPDAASRGGGAGDGAPARVPFTGRAVSPRRLRPPGGDRACPGGARGHRARRRRTSCRPTRSPCRRTSARWPPTR